MTAVSPPWIGIVLAGGQSSRMGSDKATLRWGGQTLLEHVRSQLSAAGASRVLICGRADVQDAVPDANSGQGPLAALAQLLPHLNDGVHLVVPVDMPLLSVGLLQHLASTDASCAAFAAHPLPMRLQLTPQVRQVLEKLSRLAAPQRSLRALQNELGALLLDATPWAAQLRGCNTPEEWKALQQWVDCPPSVHSN